MMNVKYALCGIALAALSTSAFAAGEFYVVQDAATKKCSIVEQKPTLSTMTVVGTTVYKTQADAAAGMKVEKVCTVQ